MDSQIKTTLEHSAGHSAGHDCLVRRQFGDCTMMLADCRDVLPIACDAVVTDPPYGIAYDASHKKYPNGKNHGDAEWDKEPYDPSPILKLGKPSIVWGGNCFASRLPDFAGWLCWVKINRNGTKIRQAEMELAWTNCIRRSQSYRYNWIGAGMEGETNRVNGGTVHPTQKPVPLMAWCMDVAGIPTGATVLDPYMGSGTTAIACIRTGRKFVGIEKDAKHFETACERVANELAQGVLLPHNDRTERLARNTPDARNNQKP